MRMILASVLLLAQAAAPSPAPAGAPEVAVVPIHGPIDLPNLALVRRAVREMLEKKPAAVVFEIDTPGGRLDHMVTMGEEIMKLAPIPTVAYVRPAPSGEIMGGAISAGVYVAISCQRLYMYPGTVIGASAPVMMTPEGPVTAGEKSVSLGRTKFRARAEQNGYPATLIEAMVDQGIEVHEATINGKKVYLSWPEIDKERAAGKTVENVSLFDSKDKLVTLTDRQVVDTGMGKIAASRAEIYSDLKLAAPVEIQIVPSWSESLVAVITSDVVAMILLVIGVVGLWIEFKTPGFGVPGVVGTAALLLYFFGHSLAGLAQATDIVLFVIGVALVLVEILLLPTGGILAILGVLFAGAGLILSLQGFTLPDTTSAPWEVDVLLSSVGRTLTSLVAATVLFLIALRFLPRLPVANRLVLQANIGGTAPGPSTAPGLAGRHGHATTPLRPGGKIAVDGEILDVVAEGEFVAAGEPVEVLRVEGMRIVVARTKR